MIKKYDFIFSLGAACSCSSCLRGANLQFASYPFDWLYGSDLIGRVSLLCHGFDGWLDKEALVHIGTREHPLPCDIYRNTKTEIVFNHDFPLGEDFDKAYDEVVQKYNRRIERLIKSINKAKKVLAVFINLPDNSNLDSKMITDAKVLLDETFGKDKFDILCLQYKSGLDVKNAEESIPQEGIKILAFDYGSKEENAENWEVDCRQIREWLIDNYAARDKRSIGQKISYYFKRKKNYLRDFGDNIFEQIICNIQYKLWKHLNKKLSKRGIIK